MARAVIVDAGGERAADHWPLRIGSAPGVDIQVGGAATDGDIARLDVLDQRLFLQRIGTATGVTVNDEPVTSNRWLVDGDIVTVRGVTIACELTADTMRLRVGARPADYPTLPPDRVMRDDASTAADLRIRPAVSEAAGNGVAPPAVREQAAGARRTWWIGMGALSLLLLVAGYLFTSKAVFIDAEPPEANIQIAGGWFKLRFGERFLLRPGTYHVIASAEGYAPSRSQFVVDDADSQSFAVVLEKLPGRLIVATRPPVDARVSIDGQLAGLSAAGPLTVAAGPHAVRLVTERFLDFDTTVDIEGRGMEQTLDAELIPGWADVTFATQPAGATIFVDGVAAGQTPATVPVMAGAHDIEVRHPGRKTWRRPLVTVAGAAQAFTDIALDEVDGVLSVTTRPGDAAVSVDGRYRGRTPVEVELAPGAAYNVLVTKPGFAPVSRTVRIDGRTGASLQLDLEARTGVVTVSSIPPQAELFVDGRPAGRTGQSLTLPARPHSIEIRHPGYAPFTAQVTPKPGLPETLDVRLLTPDEAVLAAKPQVVTTAQGASLRLLGGGRFDMGSPRREQGRRPNESRYGVRLTRPFYLATHEVTNAQFRAFKPKHTSGAEKYGPLGYDAHPAVMLSWEEATGYCNWLSAKDGLPFAYVVTDGAIVLASPPNNGYRLPTEAEWVWAARYDGAGTPRRYPWGDDMPPTGKAGNFADLSARSILTNVLSNYNDDYPVTAPVGSFAANPAGLFDLGGNVAEWVNDRYGIRTGGAGVEADPFGPADGPYHVVRGSGWRHSSIGELRLAYRDFGDRGRLDVGFRIARYADPVTAENR